MRRVDILIAKLKAKQTIRKVKEARQLREMEKMTNATPDYSRPTQRPPEGQGLPPGEQSGLGGNNGLGGQP